MSTASARQVSHLRFNVVRLRALSTGSINESRVINNEKAVEKAVQMGRAGERRGEFSPSLLGEMRSSMGIETGAGAGTGTSTGMGLGTGARGCVAVAQSAHEDTLSRAALALGCGGASQFNRFDIRLELS